MTAKRIMFTGGSGKAGRHVVQYLVDQGHQVLNLDTKPLDNPKVRTLITDITDSGQMFNALSSYMGLHEFDPDLRPQPVDAVVHFAAIPRIMIAPDNETFRVNVMGTYNVIEAAVKLGIRKVIIASSETTYGVVFANGHRNPRYFPLDEEYDTDPMDSYGMSKVINEQTARGFALRSGFDIYALRIGNVISPQDYALFPSGSTTTGFRKRVAWSYIDARDLGQITDLAIAKDGLGFQVFNAANDDLIATADPRTHRAVLPRHSRQAVNSANTSRFCPTGRYAKCSASRNSTAGATTFRATEPARACRTSRPSGRLLHMQATRRNPGSPRFPTHAGRAAAAAGAGAGRAAASGAALPRKFESRYARDHARDEASSSLPMPAAAVIRYICSAVEASDSGKFVPRPMSADDAEILCEDLHRAAGRVVTLQDVRHPVLEHP